MGASNSRFEEDKGLQLCRARKKFIKQALNGRCSVAAAHIAYIDELRKLGTSLRKFVEPDTHVESFTFPSRSVTPEPHAFIDKSVSRLSFSSLSPLQYADTTANMSASPSPSVLNKFSSHHMKFKSTFSKKVEEKPPDPVTVSITSSPTPHSIETPEVSPAETRVPSETPPWDYFSFFHPIDNHFSSQERKDLDQSSEYSGEISQHGEEEGVSDMEDVSNMAKESNEPDDEFDEPSSATLVRSFENVSRRTGFDTHVDSSIVSHEHGDSETMSPSSEKRNKAEEFFTKDSSIKSLDSSDPESKLANNNKHKSPELSPLRASSSRFMHVNDVKISPIAESEVDNKVAPKDFLSSIKDMEQLFVKASESGKEVPRMLEANKIHFRPVFSGKERGSIASSLLKSCFSCGDDPNEVKKEPPQGSVKYLTWHRTTLSPSPSSRSILDENSGLSKNLFEDFCMVSGSHASTLDRLYAWEKKLYDEVKAGQVLRSNFDQKCKVLRQKESQGINSDKTRALVKDLHTRIRVSLHRINSISKKIEEIRDKELQPQLEELIQGLRRMWEMMLECHSLQFLIISTSNAPESGKTASNSDPRRQITVNLENELNSVSSCFTKWIGAQRIYIEAIDKWLFKCVSLPQSTSKRNRRMKPPPIRNMGPPIYIICGEWLEMIARLPSKEVVDSIRDLTAEVAHFLPHQEKDQSKSTNCSQKDALLDNKQIELESRIPAFDSFLTNLTCFLGKLNEFAESSVKMFIDLENGIRVAKNNYDRFKSHQS